MIKFTFIIGCVLFYYSMCVVCLTVASVAAVALSLAVSGCSKKAPQEQQQATQISQYGTLASLNLPDWVLNPYANLKPNVIAGVGISKKPERNEQVRFLLIQAEAAARAEIATTLQSEISRITKDAMQSASIDESGAIESSFATATTEVVKNVPLSGAVRDQIFQDSNGVVYARVIINANVVKQYLEESISTYASSLREAGLSREKIQAANQSLKHLFDELDLKSAQASIKTKEE